MAGEQVTKLINGVNTISFSVKRGVAVRADRYKIFYRINNIFFSYLTQRNYMMNFYYARKLRTVCFFKVHAANGAYSTVSRLRKWV